MSIEQIRELRARTNVSLNECKTALEEAGGSIAEAIVVLQKRGALKAGDLSSHVTKHGQLFTYNHDGRIVGMVELRCETDFAARSPTFATFGELLAMQVVGANPTYVRREEIPHDVFAKQMVIFGEQSKTQGMPTDRLNKIVEGKMAKWLKEVCLMEQAALTQPEKIIEELRCEVVAKLGENVVIGRFTRWQIGH